MSAFLASFWHRLHTGMKWKTIFYFKCRTCHYTLPIDDFVKRKGTRLTLHSLDQDLLISKCHTKLFQSTYFNRTAKVWNALAEFTRTYTFLYQIKPHLLQRYSAAFCTNYNVTNFN